MSAVHSALDLKCSPQPCNAQRASHASQRRQFERLKEANRLYSEQLDLLSAQVVRLRRELQVSSGVAIELASDGSATVGSGRPLDDTAQYV